MKEAMFYESIADGRVLCNLCSLYCRIAPGRRGACGVRINLEQTLYTLVYDKVVGREIDPIEKKPLFHFYPGSTSYSIATVGCNFRCLHCQNYAISQNPKQFPIALEIAPEMHARMQAVFQERIDAAVSKTLNLPPEAPISAVREVYRLARELRLKGITVYRYGTRVDQALSLVHEEAHRECRECAA